MDVNFELDGYDRKILALLQGDARMSYTEIGRRIHLTAPAVTERVRRLEEAGVIDGFTARVSLRALGYGFEAFVNIVVESHDALDAWAEEHPEVLALHATTGEHCALMRIAVREPEHLQNILKSLARIGKTSTAIVLSSQFEERVRMPAAQLPGAAADGRREPPRGPVEKAAMPAAPQAVMPESAHAAAVEAPDQQVGGADQQRDHGDAP